MYIGLTYPANLGEFRSLFERACVSDGLFSTVACKSDTRAQMASEVYVGPKVLQSNIHTVSF